MKDYKILILFDFYGDYLSDKQREIFDLYYNEDLSLSEIAENCSMTRQGARDYIKRTEFLLVELEDKLHFSAKATELKKIKNSVESGKAPIRMLYDFIDNF